MADAVLEMPKQWETMVGERGVNLSGGQKQRLTLARALLRPSPLLILDDCFSSVDTETEDRILSRMRSVIEKSTTVIITHRVSTLRYADKIVVVEDGKVAECGSHAELLERRGRYFVLFEKQQIAERLEKV
jgi:ATP-binding cassette subfamily B protein